MVFFGVLPVFFGEDSVFFLADVFVVLFFGDDREVFSTVFPFTSVIRGVGLRATGKESGVASVEAIRSALSAIV